MLNLLAKVLLIGPNLFFIEDSIKPLLTSLPATLNKKGETKLVETSLFLTSTNKKKNS